MPWVKRQVAPRTASEAVDGTLEALVASHYEACRGGNRAVSAEWMTGAGLAWTPKLAVYQWQGQREFVWPSGSEETSG
jgi:hypothetical protein